MRLPVSEAVRERWRAAGAWTDETLLDRLAGRASQDERRELIVDREHRLTGADLRMRAARVACALQAEGIGPGDIVVYQLPNWWESAALAWGILLAGAVASPLTPTLRHAEVGFVLEQTGARLTVVPHSFRGFDHAAMLDEIDYRGATWIARSGALDEILGDEGARVPQPVEVSSSDAALVLWTSGTTSEPKGVVHTHQSLRHEADSLGDAHAFDAGDRQLLPMPMTHVAGYTYGVLMPVCLGVPAVLMDVWDPGAALRLVEREHVSVMISTPVFVRSMIDHPDFATADTSTVRLLSLGGAGVAPSTVREGAASFGGPGGCWCKRTYGSTEYPTLTTGRLGDDPEMQATTDGALIGPAEVRIVDPNSLVDVAEGQPGELWARGPEMCSGYLDAALDETAFAAGGWLQTGDLATYSGGYLTIIDRLKDIVIRGGENISAAEVEHALLSHPAVADCAVVAMPDPVMGERVCAFVIARGEPPTLAALAAHVAAQGLAPFKRPERLEVRDILPRTPSGKVQKGPLRDEVARLVATHTPVLVGEPDRSGRADPPKRNQIRAQLEERLVRRSARDAPGTVLGAGSDDLEAGRAYLRALADGGWAVPTWPVEHGGLGASGEHLSIVQQELARFAVPDLYPFLVGLSLVGPTLLEHGTDEQRARWLAAIKSGDEIWCQLFSEPDAGSDLAGLSTRAIRDGDEWVVDGQKVWTSRGHYARRGLLLARTDATLPKHAGITVFGLDMQAPGVDVRPLRQMNGDTHFTEVFLTGVRISDRDRIGPVGGGWRVALTT
ncbi:MAG: hypothetical protein QOH10_2586, partial [Actinomycetota bacterium]|nr:hypothetical protein [Actinomycetota bacterium]